MGPGFRRCDSGNALGVRVVVVGATGNVGTSLLAALGDESAVESLVGVARRRPGIEMAKTDWAQADIGSDDLAPLFAGANAVFHLAWLLQPSRDPAYLWRVNVEGSTRVFAAVRRAGVRTLVYASSIAAYSPGPSPDARVDERWSTGGVPSNGYSLQKAEVERRLDRFEREAPEVRVVRLRPALTFKYESATEQRRLFAGPFLPGPLIRKDVVPFVPHLADVRVQGLHSDDVADAYRRALVTDARGPFNVAGEPPLGTDDLARLLEARRVPVPRRAARALAAASWRLRLTPIPASWLDLVHAAPLLDTGRAREVLGWEPRHTALEALAEVIRGIRDGAGLDTPPLSPTSSGPLRSRELATRVGGRDSV